MSKTMSSEILKKQPTERALMPPPVQGLKRIKRPAVVLEEDHYESALSHIIARDYFPGLLETRAQREYLDALESKNAAWIVSAGRDLTAAMTPRSKGRRQTALAATRLPSDSNYSKCSTPIAWAGQTPKSTLSPSSPSGTTVVASSSTSTPKIDTTLRLSAFQERYTSEDNESFYKLLDKQNKKKADKYQWVYQNNKIPTTRQLQLRKALKAKEGRESSEEGRSQDDKFRLVRRSDARPAMPETWSYAAANGLMFMPDSIEDHHTTVVQKREEASSAPPKAILPHNTRLPLVAPSSRPEVPPSPSFSAVKDALEGRPRIGASDISILGDMTPRVNGYSFVDSEEPEPTPENMEKFLPKVEGAMTNSPYKLHESSSREKLHHRMVDKVARNQRRQINATPAAARLTTPRFTSSPRINKHGSLTPAAERLLGKVGKGLTPRSNEVWSNQAQAKNWTPQHKRSGLSHIQEALTPYK